MLTRNRACGHPARRILLSLLAATVLLGAIAGPAQAGFGYVSQFGGYGSANGQFIGPQGIALGADGYAYVVDAGNDRVQKFTPARAYAGQWGVYGDGQGQFTSPHAVAISGSVFVTDEAGDWATDQSGRVQKFSASGAFQSQWWVVSGVYWAEPGGIAIDAAHSRIFVSDASDTNPSVRVFDMAGSPITSITANGLNAPQGLAVDGAGNLYVANTGGGNIKVFKQSDLSLLRTIGSQGQGDGQLNQPRGVAIDLTGDVWVADTNNNRIQQFSADGAFISLHGSAGSGAGQFYEPYGIAVDAAGQVLVTDSGNDRVQIFGEGAEPPLNTAAPSIGGTAYPGGELFANLGGWGGDVPQQYGYQWLRDGVVVGTYEYYDVQPADVGHVFVLRVTATNSAGEATADSAPVTITTGATQPPPGVQPPGSQPPGVQPLGPDVTAPELFAGVGRQVLKTVVKKGVAVSATMDEAGKATLKIKLSKAVMRKLKLKLKGGVLGSTTLTFGAGGGSKAAYIKLNAKSRKAFTKVMRRKGSIKCSLESSAVDSAGNKTKVTRASYTLTSKASG